MEGEGLCNILQCSAGKTWNMLQSLQFRIVKKKMGHVKKTNWGDNVIVFLGHGCQGQKLQIGKDVPISKEGPLMCN